MKAKLAIVEPAPELDPRPEAAPVAEAVTPPPDALADLIAQRDALESEIVRLNGARTRLAALVDEENDAIATVGEIGSREVEAFRSWALAGGVDAAPELLTAERRAAAEKLALAQAKAAGAEKVIVAFEREQAEIHGRQLDLARKIEALIFDRLQGEFRSEANAINAAVLVLRQRAAALGGLSKSILDIAENLQRRGLHDEAVGFFQRAERLPQVNLADIGPTGAEIDAGALEWIARAEAMRRGAK